MQSIKLALYYIWANEDQANKKTDKSDLLRTRVGYFMSRVTIYFTNMLDF